MYVYFIYCYPSILPPNLLSRPQISKLEESLVEVEGERRGLLSNLEAEKARVEELRARVHQMEVEVKEKEVLQQFLEKEIVAREEEVSVGILGGGLMYYYWYYTYTLDYCYYF